MVAAEQVPAFGGRLGMIFSFSRRLRKFWKGGAFGGCGTSKGVIVIRIVREMPSEAVQRYRYLL